MAAKATSGGMNSTKNEAEVEGETGLTGLTYDRTRTEGRGRGRGGGGRRGGGRGRGRGGGGGGRGGRGGYPWWEHLPGGSRHSSVSEEEKARRREEKRLQRAYGGAPPALLRLPPAAAARLARAARDAERAAGGRPLGGEARGGGGDGGRGRRRGGAGVGGGGAAERGMVACQHPSEELLQRHRRRQEDPTYLRALEGRGRLPAAASREEVVTVVEYNQVVLISGETGCGKTTQVPQFLLDAAVEDGRGAEIGIVVTQPRRICAISVAERVASERAERVGATVGYQIRLERRAGPGTQVLFCTTGILLRRLQVDPELRGCTHVILDEVHERTLESDFLLIILRDLLPRRPDLRLVLMSATLNAEIFSAYFNNCPIVHIPGFTHPVEEFYLEDVLRWTGHRAEGKRPQDLGPPRWGSAQYRKKRKQLKDRTRRDDETEASAMGYEEELISQGYSEDIIQSLRIIEDDDEIPFDLLENLVCKIHSSEGEGAILIFLPGWGDISKLHKALQRCQASAQWELFALHSQMPSAQQRTIFQHPPRGKRKIIVATNIAESSITIDDVVFVVDSGKHKEKSYDAEAKLASLLPTWVSRASAAQRRGRAGRTRPGKCWRLYARRRHAALEEYQAPEMLREPLDNLCLQVRGLGLARRGPGGVAGFLRRALTPPSDIALHNSIEKLMKISAMHDDEELSPLGNHLLLLPVEPQIGKALVYACLLGCLEPILTVAAMLSMKSPFMMPLNVPKEVVDKAKVRFAKGEPSDHFALLEVFAGWREAWQDRRERDFCHQNFLSGHTLRMVSDVRDQFRDLLIGAGILAKDVIVHRLPYSLNSSLEVNRHAASWPVVRAAICSGLYPNLIRVEFRKKRPKFVSRDYDGLKLHPGSVNAQNPGHLEQEWLVYHELVKGVGGTFVYDSSEVTPLPVLLFGINARATVDDRVHGFSLTPSATSFVLGDDWIAYDLGSDENVYLVKKCQEVFDSILDKHLGQTLNVEELSPEKSFLDEVASALVEEARASEVYADDRFGLEESYHSNSGKFSHVDDQKRSCYDNINYK